MDQGIVSLIRASGDIVRAVFGSLPGLLCVAGAFVLFACGTISSQVRKEGLLHEAAGRPFGLGARAAAAFGALLGFFSRLLSSVPQLAMTAVVLFMLVGFSDVITGFDAMTRNQERIRELSGTVRNLERRVKVADVRCVESSGGSMTLDISYFSPVNPSVAAKTQSVTIAGRELYLDAFVFNFAYSEIESAREANLAIPYRVFSDQVAQADGIALDLFDANGVPLIYARKETDVYGMDAKRYGERLKEIVSWLKSDAEARKAGIVRSLYGNAVHRVMKRGDILSIWVEQSGGITVKDPVVF